METIAHPMMYLYGDGHIKPGIVLIVFAHSENGDKIIKVCYVQIKAFKSCPRKHGYSEAVFRRIRPGTKSLD